MFSHLVRKPLFRSPQFIRSISSLDNGVLVRDFIKDSLYNKTHGYNRNKKTGVLEEPLDFGNIWGKWEFNRIIKSVYDKQGVNYMNAVEIFTPHFSEAIAQSIAHSHKLGTPLHVMEVASGSTTNLSAFLSYMKKKLPNMYKNMKYYLLVDDVYFKPLSIPEEFAEKVIIKDISRREECLHICDSAYLVMNDIMSCLPHDKIHVDYGTKGDRLEQYRQGIVIERSSGNYEEVFLPVVDPLIKRYVELMLQNDIDMMTLSEHQNASIDAYNKNSALGTNRADRFKRFSPLEAFIPTVLLDILEKVMRLTTNCHVVAYDFDYLPPCAEGDLNSPINCINGPIVCKYDDKGNCTDLNTYLRDKYQCDIFFSTDFTTLSAIIQTLTRNPCHIQKLSAFVKENAKIVRTRTMLGWNPVMKDFTNLSFLVSLLVCCWTVRIGASNQIRSSELDSLMSVV